MFDLKITGATIVDGTGQPRFQGDVAVQDGIIVAVGPKVEGDARDTLDATGLLPLLGWIE